MQKDKDAEESSQRFLPALPDVRKVVLDERKVGEVTLHNMIQQIPQTQHTSIKQVVAEVMVQINIQSTSSDTVMEHCNKAKEVISLSNTTIISDYVVGCFSTRDKKWKVQGARNDTLQSIAWKMQHDCLDVQKQYIFILLGHNQLWTQTKGTINDAVTEIVQEIRACNLAAWIFFRALLPRPIDNTQAKPRIVKFNRNLCQVVKKIQNKVNRISFLSIQHDFIKDSLPDETLFTSDRVMLNELGAQRLRSALFKSAGFRVNL